MLPLPLRGYRAWAYVLSGALVLGAGTIEFYRRHASTRERARFGLLRDDVELFADAFQTSLRVPEACGAIFGPDKVTPGERRAAELKYKFAPDAPDRLAPGVEPWPGTTLGRFDLSVPRDPDFSTRFGDQILKRYRARLDATFGIPGRFASGVARAFEVLIWLDDQNSVRACFGPSSVGALCNLTGGFYDPAADAPERRCVSSLHARVESADGPLPRGSCRVTSVVRRPRDCPGGVKQALVTQTRAGFGSDDFAICRTCD